MNRPSGTHHDSGAATGTVQGMNRLQRIIDLAHTESGGDHLVDARHPYAFLTEYDFGKNQLANKLARQGQSGMWSVDDLDWDLAYDPGMLAPLREVLPRVPRFHPGSSWDRETWQRYEIANLRYILSQGLHGEQLGVIVGGELCQSGPDWDTKTFAGFMAADEVRHAHAFHRYLERVGGKYEMTDQMYSVVREVLESKEWDKVFLVGQVLVEGLGLGTFGYLLRTTNDPLLTQMLRLAMRDEARHVAFGAANAKNLVEGLTDTELMERLELIAHCAELLVNRIIPVTVAEEFEIDPKQYIRAVRMSPALREMEMNLFAHIGPICSRLGLLDRCDGWLRQEFEKLGLLDIPESFQDEAERCLADVGGIEDVWFAGSGV
jgi:1,2-phenylacetyl-CoA epoxidase catalytic subunit